MKNLLLSTFIIFSVAVAIPACDQTNNETVIGPQSEDKKEELPLGQPPLISWSAKAVYPTEGEENIILRPEIKVKVGGADPSAMTIVVDPPVAGEIKFDSDVSLLTFVPAADLEADRTYTVMTMAKAAEVLKFGFRTMKGPISEVAPRPSGTGTSSTAPITIRLADFGPSVKGVVPQITTDPNVPLLFAGRTGNEFKWVPSTKWPPNTLVKVDLNLRWFDSSGFEREAPFSWTFTTAYTGIKQYKMGVDLDSRDWGEALIVDPSGDIIMTGEFASLYGGSALNTSFRKLSKGGNVVMGIERYYYGEGSGTVTPWIFPFGEGYIALGMGYARTTDKFSDFSVRKLDKYGNILSDDLIDIDHQNDVVAKAISHNGILYITGRTCAGQCSNADRRVFLFKYDPDNEKLERVWLDTENGEAYDMVSDGANIYISGFTRGASPTQAWLKRWNGTNMTELFKVHPDAFRGIEELSSGSLAIFGFSAAVKGDKACVGGYLWQDITGKTYHHHHPWFLCGSVSGETFTQNFLKVYPSAYEYPANPPYYMDNLQGLAFSDDGRRIYAGGSNCVKKKYVTPQRFLDAYDAGNGELIAHLFDPAYDPMPGWLNDVIVGDDGSIYATGGVHTMLAENPGYYYYKSNEWVSRWDGDYNLLWEKTFTNDSAESEYVRISAASDSGIFVAGQAPTVNADATASGKRVWFDKVGLKGEKLPGDPFYKDEPFSTIYTPISIIPDGNGNAWLGWWTSLVDPITKKTVRPFYIGRFDDLEGTLNWDLDSFRPGNYCAAESFYIDKTDPPNYDLFVFGCEGDGAPNGPGMDNMTLIKGTVKKFRWMDGRLSATNWKAKVTSTEAPSWIFHGGRTPAGSLFAWGVYGTVPRVSLYFSPANPVRLELSAEGTIVKETTFNVPLIYIGAGGFAATAAEEYVMMNGFEGDSPEPSYYFIKFNRADGSHQTTKVDISPACSSSELIYTRDNMFVMLPNGNFATVIACRNYTNTGRHQGYFERGMLIIFDESGRVLYATQDTDISRYHSLTVTPENIVVTGSIKTKEGVTGMVEWLDMEGNR